ncbi:hypothetical protein GQ44DRAFT_333772 [Phaeosphaeriaceae sp. PMI808]|nr:hypothetical protein GQ44DRAFT_333772 [Phaeosphaeriaceae sp. PMI808]
MEVCPSYLKRHSLPPEIEVKQLKNYDYHPCPPDIEEPLLQNQFMHELFKPGPHLDGYWTESFPKKLKDQLNYISGQRPVGWGIIINEGINWPILWFGVLFTLILTGIVVLACAMRTGDVSSAAGLGAYFVATLTLVVTLQYYKWQEQSAA